MADINLLFADAVARHQAGDLDTAERLYREILHIAPEHLPVLCNLGAVLVRKDRFEEAGQCYARCISTNPDYADAHYNFGNLFRRLGQLRESVAEYHACLRINPRHPSALFNLGMSELGLDNLPAAEDCFRQAIDIEPDYADAYARLGDILLRSGHAVEGVELFRKYVTLRPKDPRGLNNLGLALSNANRASEAIELLQQAIALKPDYPDAHNTIALAYETTGKKDLAIEHYRTAVRIHPDFADAWSNLGTSLTEQGRADEAIEALQKSLSIRQNAAPIHSNYLLTLNYSSSKKVDEIADEHRRWASLFAPETPPSPMPNDPRPDRVLKIGYLSGDFRTHTVAGFIELLLTHHNRDQFHITGFSTVQRPDEVTEKLGKMTDHFVMLMGLSDEQIAQRIHNEQIDILIDLSGHTAGNRLLALARRPASLQMTLFGYPNTTGLAAVDYRITDAIADPEGMTERLYVEKLLRMPGLAWAYQPPKDAPEVGPLPCLSRSTITFGCLNNAAKISDECLATWSRLIAEVPGSRLVMLAGQSEAGAKRLSERFQAAGIHKERVELVMRLPRKDYFESYQLFDLALDPFPYNGGVTTCDALWMGVPVLTVAGESYVSRQGASIMTHAGLSEFIAESPDKLIELAKTWATNREWLAEIRAGMRSQFSRSSIANGKGYVQALESALRDCWKQRIA